MDYALATFDGAHFAHIAARDENLRMKRIAEANRRAYRSMQARGGIHAVFGG